MVRHSEQSHGRTQVIELISRYFAAIGDKRLDRAIVETTFSPDGKIIRPNGAEFVGPKAITEGQSESFGRFRATHHIVTDHVVDMESDRARVRANVVGTHLWGPGQGDPSSLETHFTAGGVLAVEACGSSPVGAFRAVSNRVVWRTGSGFSQMLATGQPAIGANLGAVGDHLVEERLELSMVTGMRPIRVHHRTY